MTAPVRIATAAIMIAIGLWLSRSVRGLVTLVDENAARLGFEMMGIEIGLMAIAISAAWALPGPITDRLGLRASRLPTGAVIALVIGTLGLSHAIEAALSLTRVAEHSVMTGISRGLEGAHGRGFAIALLGTVLAPAIGEELLCRGVLQRSLARWLGPVAAVLIASLAFGWLHAELVHGFVAASIGCYLGLAAYWSDSTRPAIAAHAANNLAALLGSAGLLSTRLPLLPGFLAGVSLAAIGLIWASRMRPHGVHPNPPRAPQTPEPEPLQPQRDSADL